jgi:aminomethyltransferase
VLDDAIVFMLAAEAYLVVVNAGMGQRVAAHLDRHREQRDVRVHDLSGQFGKMDVQGPMAAHVMRDVLADPDAVFEAMPYFAFKGGFSETMPSCGQVLTRDGTSLLLSRTGYTGEFGFEIFTSADTIVGVWEAVMAAGAHYGALPCGLAARDSLRAGAVLPLSHQDIGDWPFCNHPWPFALPYKSGTDDFSKTFLGDTALKTDSCAPYLSLHRRQSAEGNPAGRGTGCHGPGHRECVDLRHRYGDRMARGSRFEHRQPRCARGIHARRTLLRVSCGWPTHCRWIRDCC